MLDVINNEEQTTLGATKEAFEGENMQTQHSVFWYRINLYFHDCKLAIEVDELGHKDRDNNYKIDEKQSKNNLL